MNRRTMSLTAAGLVLIAGSLAGCSAITSGSPDSPSSAPGSSTAPTAAQVLPIASDPITNTSTAAGLSINSAAVEDNVDPVTKKAIDDRLQITLANATSAPLTNVEIYYEMTDVTTKQTEGYYMALDGVTVPSNGQSTVYFDNEPAPGHFPENKFSLYRSSVNQVDFAIEASADDVKIATATASKGAGTGEQAD